MSKLDVVGCLALLALTSIAAFLWYHSYASPYRSSWSKPEIRACGRILSENGRFVWQKCTVTTYQNPGTNQSLPFSIFAGTNPSGDRTTVPCGVADVAFTMPEPGRFVGVESGMNGFGNGTLNYQFEWKEATFKYAFAVCVLLVVLILSLIQPAFRLATASIRNRQQQRSALGPAS